jgi:hypothetical protein
MAWLGVWQNQSPAAACAVIAANVTGTQASGTPIPAGTIKAQVTSGGVAYSVTLPASVTGASISVMASTATNTVAVFPAPGDTINALGVNAGITMAAQTSAIFECVVAGQWWTIPRVPS